MHAFLDAVRTAPPERALIRDVRASWLAAAGLAQFEIRTSDAVGERSAIVLPDIATCDACLRDIVDPGGRRCGYAFTNCTDCGPRFTIVRALPYDRASTTMAGFRMCAPCAAEYDDPGDRRFPRAAERLSGVRAAARAVGRRWIAGARCGSPPRGQRTGR